MAKAAPTDAAEIERLYIEGQQRDESKDYKGAAESWTRLLRILPESGENQPLRESLIINVLDAHIKAYNQLVDESGNKDIEHLREGKRTLDEYYSDFKAIHGDRVAVSAAVQEKAEILEAQLIKAERVSGAPSDPQTGSTTSTQPQTTTSGGQPQEPQVIVVRSGDNGTGLIAGGAVAAALGLAALAMIPIGVVRANDAEDRFDPNDTDSPQSQEARFDGEQGDDILIAGAVLAPLLLGGATAMLYFGIKRRRDFNAQQARLVRGVSAVRPVAAPGFGGISLRGHF